MIVYRATSNAKNGNYRKVKFDDVLINFDEFCKLVTEFQFEHNHYRHMFGKITNFIANIVTKLIDITLRQVFAPMLGVDQPPPRIRQRSSPSSVRSYRQESPELPPETPCRDLYLGGELSGRWRNEIAIPKLRKNGLTFFTPLESWQSSRLSPIETTAIEHSNILLFAVTSDTRSVATMLLVSCLSFYCSAHQRASALSWRGLMHAALQKRCLLFSNIFMSMSVDAARRAIKSSL